MVILDQRFPTFFDAFLPLLILELFIPPQLNFHFSPVRVRKLVLNIIGTMVFINEKNLIIKNGKETICFQIMALKLVDKNVW